MNGAGWAVVAGVVVILGAALAWNVSRGGHGVPARAVPDGSGIFSGTKEPLKMEVLQQPVPRDPDEADRAVFAAMKSAGANLSRPTDIAHYLYLSKRTDAEAAAGVLRAHGFAVLVDASGDKSAKDWLVLANRTEVPSPENLRASRAIFAGLAVKYGGDYDGWEAAVVK